jgi:two-component system response regulator YesN
MEFFGRLILRTGLATGLSRFFYKLFFSSIILITVVLVILGGMVYINFINTFQSEVEKANIAELAQIVENMDMRFKEMDCIAVDISSNTEFDYLGSSGEADSAYKMVRELHKYKSGNEFLSDIVYYSTYESENRIITSNGEMDADFFFKYIYHYDHWGKNRFFDLIANMDGRIVRPLEPILLNNQLKTNIVTYIYPLPLTAAKPSRVVLFIIVQDVLDKLIKNVVKEFSGSMYILDEKNRLIFSSGKASNSKKKADLLANLKTQPLINKINKVAFGGTNYSVVKLASEYNGWKYITAIQTNEFMAKVYKKETLFYVSFLIMVIIGTIIAFELARRNNKPLQKLLENLSGADHNYFNQKYRDDIEYIADVIDRIHAKNKYLLQEQFLTNLLLGRYAGRDEINAAMNETYLKFEWPRFLVAVFFIDDYSQYLNKDSKLSPNAMKFSLVDVLEEMDEWIENANGYVVETNDDRSYALIINLEASFHSGAKITDLLLYVKDFFKQSCSFTIGVGKVYTGPEKIAESYVEAKKAVYYRLIKGKNNIIFYENIQADRNQTYKYPLSLETALVKAIKHSDKDEVVKAIQELREFISNQCLPLESLRCICYGVINSVIKLVEELQMDAGDCFSDEENFLLVQTFDTVDAMLDQLTAFCMKICEYQIEQNINKFSRLKNKIFDTVNRRLQDKTLSLESLAADCEVSPSYISRYFKQQTGCSLMQYVDGRRMEKVRELLEKTNLNLNEILNKVGYIDKANFIRKFKKIEGVTPMKYRELHSR